MCGSDRVVTLDANGMVDFVSGRAVVEAILRWRDHVDKLGLVDDRLAKATPSFSGAKKSKDFDEANVFQCKRCGDITEEDMKVLRGSRHWARVVVHTFSRISFAIARGVVNNSSSSSSSNNNNNNNKAKCGYIELGAKEVDIRFSGGRQKLLRLDDMLFYSWDEGSDVWSSPLTQNGKVDFVSGRAVVEVAQCKRVKYEAKYADIGYASPSHSLLLVNLIRLGLVDDRLAKATPSFSGAKKSKDFDEANVTRSFRKGTSCGHDGLRAQHLMDILGGNTSVIANDVL
uniref:Uncharacterized protein n=1 Tax=Tanacetum cinerariifolium TaxID=118510 RepID=A0A699KGW4_TANCI|nr:hypothetical protein [Tanacetum cinerariifolium]